jgi:hypothetical protein
MPPGKKRADFPKWYRDVITKYQNIVKNHKDYYVILKYRSNAIEVELRDANWYTKGKSKDLVHWKRFTSKKNFLKGKSTF